MAADVGQSHLKCTSCSAGVLGPQLTDVCARGLGRPVVIARVWSIALDFQSVNALKKFYEAFDDKIVQLDEKVIMKLHFSEVRGQTEKDWFKAFYGSSRAKSRSCTWAGEGARKERSCRVRSRHCLKCVASLYVVFLAVENCFRVAEPGSRPDTVVLRNVPAEWFGIAMRATKQQYAAREAPLRRALVKFGAIRCADVPPPPLPVPAVQYVCSSPLLMSVTVDQWMISRDVVLSRACVSRARVSVCVDVCGCVCDTLLHVSANGIASRTTDAVASTWRRGVVTARHSCSRSRLGPGLVPSRHPVAERTLERRRTVRSRTRGLTAPQPPTATARNRKTST